MIITKTKNDIRIPFNEWNKLKKNPLFMDLIELLEDSKDLEEAKSVTGKDLTLAQYLKKRAIQSNY